MYEHKSQKIIPIGTFILRQLNHVIIAMAIIIGSLSIGVLGYHIIENMTWIDSLLNAAMIS